MQTNTNDNRRRIHSHSYEKEGLNQPIPDYRITSISEMTEDMISEELRQVYLLLVEAQMRIRSLQKDYSKRLLALEEKERRVEAREVELNK